MAIQKHTRDYYAVITELDGFLGKLFKKVKELGLEKNTYIIFMSDNGWMLGDHGFTSKVLPYEPSTHIPFWILGPDIAPASNNSLVSNLDILPTILELSGTQIPSNLHGQSLVPLLNGKQKKVRDFFIYEGLGLYGGVQHNLAVLTEKYRYIKTYTDSTLEKVEFTELYNQQIDKWEIDNIAQKKENKGLLKEMDKQIYKFRKEILNIDEVH